MAVDSLIRLNGIGAAAFVATNIDDIVVLMVFFSSSVYQARHIVIGQYLGIGSLIAISALGSLLALVVPPYVIGLMGLVPIAIGTKELIEKRNNKKKPEEEEEEIISKGKLFQQSNNKGYNQHYFSFISASAVTISNGGDNIGIYTPLFATYNSSLEVITLTSLFMAMTAFWCVIGYYLVTSAFREENVAFRASYTTLCFNWAWNLHNDRGFLVLIRISSIS